MNERPPATLDQRDWMFTPHVLAVRSGQRVRFVNSDVANHNVHSTTRGREFNIGTPSGFSIERTFRRPTGTRPARIDCDIHDWMRAWIYVFEHDAFAVTDRAGSFRIDRVPPGTWRLRAHHADGAVESSLEVRVAAEETVEVVVEVR